MLSMPSLASLVDTAKALDHEGENGNLRGPLQGIPIMLMAI